MIYRDPQDVNSPRDFVENVEVIHDGGEEGYSLAKIEWEGTPCFAIRWNVARREWDNKEKQREERECVGMPSSRAQPVWFVLPDDFLNKNNEIWNKIEQHLGDSDSL